MYALLLRWNLAGKDPEMLDELRQYIRDKSWERYRTVRHLAGKSWLSNPDPFEFAAFYLWETVEARENEVRHMHHVNEITGVEPTIVRWDVEAMQVGQHEPIDFAVVGQAWSTKVPTTPQ